MSSPFYRVACVGVLLAAFGLRVALLDAQSLWADEGNSVVMAQRTVSEILHHATGDIHPPLYYLLLHGWAGAVGTTEFALRYLSVLFGVLLVALIARMGSELFRPSAGVLSALLAGLSPFLLHYSQEVRMYAQMALFGTLSAYLCWRLLSAWKEAPSALQGPAAAGGHDVWRWVVGYVLATAAFLYTQYFAVAFLIFQNLAFLFLFWRPWRYRTAWRWWGVSQLAVMLLYLPWLWRVREQLVNWQTFGEAISAAAFLQEVVLVFSLGRTWPAAGVLPWLGLISLLFLASGLWLRACEVGQGKGPGRSPSPRFAWSFVLLWLAVPVLVLSLLSLRRPLYLPEALKLVIPALPAYLLLLGAAAAALYGVLVQGGSRTWRHMPLLVQRAMGGVVFFGCLAGGGAAVGQSLWAYYFDPQFARDGYRSLVRYIELTAQPSDAILLVAPGQGEIFNYYYRGALAQYPLPQQRPLTEGPTQVELAEIASRHSRLWAVLWGVAEADPTRFVERWLGQHAFRTFSRWYGNVELVHYVLPSSQAAGKLAAEDAIQASLEANLAGKVRLLGYRLQGASSGESGVVVRPEDTLQLTLFWQAVERVEQPYKVFTHLIDRDGYLWGQHDGQPAGGTKPTLLWQPEEVVPDRHGIPVLPGTPPGRYQVEVGLYHQDTGVRLPVSDQGGSSVGDFVTFGVVEVVRGEKPPSLETFFPQHAKGDRLGLLRLLGYDLTKLGVEEPKEIFQRGDLAHLTLYWKADAATMPHYIVRVWLQPKDAPAMLLRQTPPVEGRYPTTSWAKDEIVRDQHKFALDVAPGRYTLLLELVTEGQKEGGGSRLVLQSLSIRAGL